MSWAETIPEDLNLIVSLFDDRQVQARSGQVPVGKKKKKKPFTDVSTALRFYLSRG